MLIGLLHMLIIFQSVGQGNLANTRVVKLLISLTRKHCTLGNRRETKVCPLLGLEGILC